MYELHEQGASVEAGGGETVQDLMAFLYDVLRDHPLAFEAVRVALEARYAVRN
jgi:hypothetical protein